MIVSDFFVQNPTRGDMEEQSHFLDSLELRVRQEARVLATSPAANREVQLFASVSDADDRLAGRAFRVLHKEAEAFEAVPDLSV